jgi:hypothetical protein
MNKTLLAMALSSLSVAAESDAHALPRDTASGSGESQLVPDQPSQLVEQPTVLLQGPLATIFSQALNIAYAKPDPISGVATESLANDQITGVAMYLAEQASKDEQTPGEVKAYSFGPMTKLDDAASPEPVAVVRDLSAAAQSVPTSFIFYQDCMQPTDDTPQGGVVTKLLPVVESIEVVVKVRHVKAP